MTAREGPPNETAPPVSRGRPPYSSSPTAATAKKQKPALAHHRATRRPCVGGTVAARLHRRRTASWRMPPLDCGCRDTWPCRCTDPPLSVHAVDSWRDAALHITEQGYTPLVPFEVLRALYRRGGADRVLAEQLHQLTGGVAV